MAINLYCGDNLDILPTLEAESVDSVITASFAVAQARTEQWWENGLLDVLRVESQSPVAIRALQEREWAFALVDGLHQYVPTLSDVLSVREARVICLDDMNMKPVSQAFNQSIDLLGREGIQNPMMAKKWEGYLV